MYNNQKNWQMLDSIMQKGERKPHNHKRKRKHHTPDVTYRQKQDEMAYSRAVNDDRPKYPDYASNEARIASYRDCPSYHIGKPKELADAGFYYAGYEDCDRCFFCGGDVKNWVYCDSPWMDHARWNSKCAYLRHCKGEQFIQKYREVEETEESGTVSNENTNPVDTDINSAAAESVREMGCRREDVQDAIQIYRTYHGNRSLTAEAMMANHNGKASGNGNTSSNGNASGNGKASGNGSRNGKESGNASRNGKESGNASRNGKESGNGNTTPGYIITQPVLDVIISEREEETSQSQKEEEASHSRCNLLSKADLRSLAEENRSLREQIMCKICMDKDACIVFLPCGHMVACSDCAPALRKCAICRKLIKGTIRAFPS